jgi:hypothetical protein
LLHENNCYNTSSAKNARPKSGPSQGSLFGVSAAAPGPRKPLMPGSFWLIRSTTRSTDGIACVNSEKASLYGCAVRTYMCTPGGPVSAGGSPWGVPKRPFWHPRFCQGRRKIDYNADEISSETFYGAPQNLPSVRVFKHEVRRVGRCRSTRFRPRRSATGCRKCAPGGS